MSHLHSETHDSPLGLTVRIKMVDLNHISASSATGKTASSQTSTECIGVIAAMRGDKAVRPAPRELRHLSSHDHSNVEICMLNGERIPFSEFESHIETCPICANRVELQLDFMETLEVAVYQRAAEPASAKVRGAMLVSAPELNFAVCGELEIG